MLLPMEDAWPAWDGDGFRTPPGDWQDENGDIVAPAMGDPTPGTDDGAWEDELLDLIASRPSRHQRGLHAHP